MRTHQEIINDTSINGDKFILTISGGCPTFRGPELATDEIFNSHREAWNAGAKLGRKIHRIPYVVSVRSLRSDR